MGIDMITNSELAEAIVVRWAIPFVLELPYSHAIIAIDCLSLVQKPGQKPWIVGIQEL